MDNPEKQVTSGTEGEDKQDKNTTQNVLATAIYKRTQMNPPTGGKNEPNIVFMRKS